MLFVVAFDKHHSTGEGRGEWIVFTSGSITQYMKAFSITTLV